MPKDYLLVLLMDIHMQKVMILMPLVDMRMLKAVVRLPDTVLMLKDMVQNQ